MPPLNNIETWGRFSDAGEAIEPRRRLYLLYEGAHTERQYFSSLVALLNRRGLPKYLAVNRCDRTGDDEGASNPKKLLELAETVMAEDAFSEDDEVVIVFDADVYRDDVAGYCELLKECEDSGVVPYVTYPAFELFLLLHLENGFEALIMPNKAEILENRKKGKRRYLDRLFSEATGMNPKSNPQIGKLATNYSLACEQEGGLNQDSSRAIGVLTSNVGLLVRHLLES